MLRAGYGFIASDEGCDRFFHWTGLDGVSYGELVVGMRVVFTVVEGYRGPKAMDVRLWPESGNC